jgi:hypothetical protein
MAVRNGRATADFDDLVQPHRQNSLGIRFARSSHGSKDMPVWGPVFRSFSGDTNVAELRVNNLVSYIESIQTK